ncbi:MAG: DMT family transporter [Planctomycetota bacterium]
MNIVPALLAFLSGGILALQVVVNSQARLRLKIDGEFPHPLQAALVNFGGGSIVLIALCLACRFAWPDTATMRDAPWWVWTGGLLGIVYVASSVVLGHRLGLTLFFTLVVAGQIVSSLAIDRFGVGGAVVREINVGRVVGALLVLVGVIVVAASTRLASDPTAEPQAQIRSSN